MPDRTIDRRELALRLRLPPRAVRTLLAAWENWLSQPQEGRFTALDVARLQVALRMTQRGYAVPEIAEELERLAAEGEAPPGAPRAIAQREAAASSPAAGVSPRETRGIREQIAELRALVAGDLERQSLDRDRILMALMRTQQEVVLLRGEMGLQRTRRGRKRGLLRRLIG